MKLLELLGSPISVIYFFDYLLLVKIMPTFADISYRYIDGNMNQTSVNNIDRLVIDNIVSEKGILKNCELMNIEIRIRHINVIISACPREKEIFIVYAADEDCNFLSFSEFLEFISS